MAESLFDELRARSESVTQVDEDALVFQEGNPLDQQLLEEVQEELIALTGCAKKDQVQVTVLTTEQFQRALKAIVPRRLHERGLAKNFRVLRDPQDRHHLYVGPSAVAGLNDGHSTVISDLVYQLIAAQGPESNLAFERGCSDLIAQQIGKRLKLAIFTDIYPAEQQFVLTLIEAIRKSDEDPLELLGLIKRSPDQFYARLRDSGFYKWWESSAQENDQLSRYVDLIASVAAPSAQIEGSFMQWAQQCAEIYCDYRVQQRKNALAGARRSDTNE